MVGYCVVFRYFMCGCVFFYIEDIFGVIDLGETVGFDIEIRIVRGGFW